MNLKVQNGRFVESDHPLAEGFVLPGFVDSHCHILPTGLDLQKIPLGGFSTREEVLDAVREGVARREGWILAAHYDQNKFTDGRHLTREELDSISPDRPILLRHVNGHASVANSAALAAAGVGEDVTDPEGGAFGRDASGRLDGLLLESAHERVTGAVPTPSLEQMVEAILAAGREMARFGVTTATDMMTGRWDLLQELRAYRLAAERGCPIRLRLCLQWGTVFGPRAVPREQIDAEIAAMERDSCSVIGIKIFADGAIGSATAAVHAPYVTTGGLGQMIYGRERLHSMIRTAHDAGYSVAIHAIGDRATDEVLDGFEATGAPERHRIEHIMIMSDAQIDRLARLGTLATMQPEFLHRFGHAYLAQLGPERASQLKRARSVIDAGIPLAFNSDRPIVLGDPLVGIRTAVSRPTGFDPAENVSWDEAVDGYTRMGAVLNGDAGLYGELKPGQLGDYTVWDKDPRDGGVLLAVNGRRP